MNSMSRPKAEPAARLSCRVNARIKHRAEEAAALLGQSITNFTETALAEKADATLGALHQLQLSERDFAHFLQIVTETKPPTAELTRAMREYEQQKVSEPKGNW